MLFAHTSEDGRTQPLFTHLQNVGELAGGFARQFGCEEWARHGGFVHDIGKSSPAFQRYLLEDGPKTEHAAAAAIALYQSNTSLLAYCAAGHHAGMPDGGNSADTPDLPTLRAKLMRQKKYGWDIPGYLNEAGLPSSTVLPRPPITMLERHGFSLSFLTRMLFSCLVDADYLDTEAFMNDTPVRRNELRLAPLLALMERHLYSFETPKNELNRKRTEILSRCKDAALLPRGLYSLTVPTGGGKTLSSMAYALRHAANYGLRRIIYVIPYTNIIEQTADVFRKIFGDRAVLEHHSNAGYDDAEEIRNTDRLYKRHANENWDIPIVVTTSVQFFESLFSNRPSKCRKLHNIANSVVIFDEAQMLPMPYLLPCVRAIAELVKNYRCTAVLCSATQPALDKHFPSEMRPVEICPDHETLYAFFCRTRFVVEEKPFSTKALADRLSREHQVLCIVNTRKQAQAVFALLQGEGCYHLSTLMYPLHRKRILAIICKRLRDGFSCKVVSTSLIEAGVDLDFPTLYRERAGLDSMIQAAGRCNREGKRPIEESLVYLFVFARDESADIPASLRLPFELGDKLMRECGDIGSPATIHAYFEQLYRYKGSSLDQKNIVGRLEESIKSSPPSFPFASVAREFCLIEESTCQILIVRNDEPASTAIARQLKQGYRSRQLLRDAGQFCVNVYANAYLSLLGAGALDVLDDAFAVLRDVSLYDGQIGLHAPDIGIGVWA
ncbi:MAG: CRISPR-associated helicase Cas3' [Clostridiales bacterium]|jgi:CRISPR-associated endonuclease/helicase Cas3|nr:CRISPR-associated helicase Cas3' [Clostridiales bacterium]